MKDLVPRDEKDEHCEGPDANIDKPSTAVFEITAANTCGLGAYTYDGRTDAKKRRILVHQNLGSVMGIGKGIIQLPAPLTSRSASARNVRVAGSCLTTSRTFGAAYCLDHIGSYTVVHADYLRAPYADINLANCSERESLGGR